MCEEIGINLSCLRSTADRDEMLQKWNELSTYNTSRSFIFMVLTYSLLYVILIKNIMHIFPLESRDKYSYQIFIHFILF